MRLLSLHHNLQCKLNLSEPKPGLPALQKAPRNTDSTCRISLTGITCAACTRSVQKALSSVPGVTSASVSLSLFQAHVQYDPSKTTPEALAAAVEDNGYGAEILPPPKSWRDDFEKADGLRKREIESWRSSFFSSILFTIPAILLPYSAPASSGPWASFILFDLEAACTAAGVFYCARHIHREALAAVRARRGDMSLLSSLGVLFGFIQSFATFLCHLQSSQANCDLPSFDAISTLVTVVLGGRYLKALVSRRAMGFAAELSTVMPSSTTVTSLRDIDQDLRAASEAIPIDFLNPDDWVIVPPGLAIPGDGVVVKGGSHVSETCITGEIAPRFKRAGDEVLAGSTNLDGELVVGITRTGTDTWLEKTLQFVARADSGRSSTEGPINTIIERFVGVVLVLAVTTVIAWRLFSDANWSECLRRDA